ncbi:uncharacterized protein LOC106643787 [Copidosoma floridanum]|uniref:uncharacterized protein LOC106643787 n=1 Tax=Copidosoma floridanum TaxID=29053 RepID=UPI0006C96590|nr:uncharacterized protein LOC106643787 [Copidosoma floridanum]
MDPAKLEGVSRQSSILKPTKPRQPLQCVAPNPDPLESSPTIKLKRRVSFAKNKRIREFCNEAEPKAVWDDTYEEHDSSGTKSNSTGGNEPLTITVSCQDKENFPVQLFLRTDQVECTEISSNTLARDDNLSQCDMEMDNTLNNPGLQNEDKENATIYCDDGMDTTYLPSRIIACHNQCTDYLNDKECMDITDNLPMVPCKNSTAHQSNKTHMLKNHGGNSTELTIAISQLLGAGHVNKQSSDPTNSQSLSENIENTAPMEFTSVIPSSTWIKPNSICHSEKKIVIDKRATDLSNATLQNNMHDEINTDGTSILLEKTKIFGDESMEITEAMPLQQIVQTNLRLCNTVPETIKTTETAAYKHIECTRKISDESLQDKTKIFNESVEATEAIPVYIENCEKVPRKNGLHPEDRDVTKYFKDKSVEVTEAIPVYIENRDEIQKK